MTTIYDKHATTFRQVTAGVIMRDGEQIGTIAFKKTGERVKCYLHIHGSKMVLGLASGAGYDLHTGAFESATLKLTDGQQLKDSNCDGFGDYRNYLRRKGYSYFVAV